MTTIIMTILVLAIMLHSASIIINIKRQRRLRSMLREVKVKR